MAEFVLLYFYGVLYDGDYLSDMLSHMAPVLRIVVGTAGWLVATLCGL